MIVAVKHNFETAHRLPFLEGKCQSIHGHSWWVEWQFEKPVDSNGLTVEYGTMKRHLRDWVDTYLDHGTMLGINDPLWQAFKDDIGCKLFTFGASSKEFMSTADHKWPTVEAVAQLLANVGEGLIGEAQIVRVEVQETHVNKAIWTPTENDIEYQRRVREPAQDTFGQRSK